MKKILFLSLVAIAAACCGPKSNEVCADKLIANPAEYVGKEISFNGTAIVTNAEAKRIAIFGTDSTKYIMVQATDSVMVCPKMCGKVMKVTGTVIEVVVDAIVADSVCTMEFIADKYIVAAKSIEKADGEAKEPTTCCVKDSSKVCPNEQ